MDEVPGSVGTSASFSLRLGQTIFSSASLLFMSLGVEFYSYTAFWLINPRPVIKHVGAVFHFEELKMGQFLSFLLSYLVTIMGLVIPWSSTLALVDGYSVLVKCPLRQPGILLIIIFGDWVLSILTLGAASSTIGVVDVLLKSEASQAPYYPIKFCSRYQMSAAMAFLSWFLSFGSFLFNLWLLPTL